MSQFDDFSDDYDDLDEDALIEEIMATESATDYDFAEDVAVEEEETSATSGRKKPELREVIEALQKELEPKSSPILIYGLSDLSEAEIGELRPAWAEIPVAMRRIVIQYLVDSSEMNQLNYRAFGLLGLQDADPRVREIAIELLWEEESLEVLSQLIALAQTDDNREVRAAAASALGRFILLGEYEELPEEDAQRAFDAATTIWKNTNEDIAVRRRALEAASNATNDFVPEAIREAYDSAYPEMRVSAVFAMGRSCDRQWSESVLAELASEDAALRYEAVRAAGELALDESVPRLAELVVGDDREIVEMAVWSLGEIGGKTAMRVLEAVMSKALSEDDDDLIEAVEDALGNATLAGELDDDDFDDWLDDE